MDGLNVLGLGEDGVDREHPGAVASFFPSWRQIQPSTLAVVSNFSFPGLVHMPSGCCPGIRPWGLSRRGGTLGCHGEVRSRWLDLPAAFSHS